MDVSASGTGQELWAESQEGAREQVFFFPLSLSLSLLLWRGSALSVTAAVRLALVGTDAWYKPPPPTAHHRHPYISLYTLHGMECLGIEDNNMHGELLKQENEIHHMGAGACKNIETLL